MLKVCWSAHGQNRDNMIDKRLIEKQDNRFNDILIILTALIIFLSLFSNIAFATYTIFDNVNITKNLTVAGLNAASCDVKANTSGFLYCGIDATGGGGAGENYWQVDATWMWPNTSAGGKNLVNVTTLNATTLNQGGNKVLDISGNIILANITDPTDCTAAQKVTGKTGSSWDCGTDLFNTSSQIWTVIDNNTFHKFSQTITWGNLSSWNLNSAWTGSLGGGNITAGTLSNASLTSTFKILLGNVTDVANCTSAQKVLGKVASAWVCDTDLFNTSTQMDTAINATANRYFQLKVNESNYWDNLNSPSDFAADSISEAAIDMNTACGSTQKLYVSGNDLACNNDLFNTSTEVKVAVNDTPNNYFQIKSNETNYINCAGIYGGSDADFCADALGGGGAGENYWQVGGGWMFPNITAGGDNDVNVTTLNATTINQNGNKVLDVSGGISLGNITNLANCSSGQLVQGKVNSAWVCTADLFNTSAQIWAVIDNNTFHKFSQTITWSNLSSWSLNNVWTGSLGGGNITTGTISTTQITDGTIATADLASGFAINFGNISAGWDLNKAWTNSLGAGNITSGTITSTQLASTFAILMGNVTDPTDCTAAQKVTGKTGSTWDCGTDLFNTSTQIDAAINATANRYFQLKVNESSYLDNYDSTYFLPLNDTWGVSIAKITGNINLTTASSKLYMYNGTICWNPACTANDTYNGTNRIIYG